jgi:hypothetical protein
VILVCRSGRHRSVAAAELIAAGLRHTPGVLVQGVQHLCREPDRPASARSPASRQALRRPCRPGPVRASSRARCPCCRRALGTAFRPQPCCATRTAVSHTSPHASLHGLSGGARHVAPSPFVQRVRRAPAAAWAEVVASLRPRRPVPRVHPAAPGPRSGRGDHVGGDAGLKGNACGARPFLAQGRLGSLSHSPPPGRLLCFPDTAGPPPSFPSFPGGYPPAKPPPGWHNHMVCCPLHWQARCLGSPPDRLTLSRRCQNPPGQPIQPTACPRIPQRR